MAVNDYREALDEALDQTYPIPETEEARQAFRINDLDQAGWAVRKYARIEDKRSELRNLAAVEIARIQAWLEREEEKLDRDASFFLNLLADYHRRILEADPKAKTIRLPHGTLQMRAQQPEFRRDDAKLLQFLESSPSGQAYIRVKREPDWAKLKPVLVLGPDGQVLNRDGEIIPGVVYEERPPKFDVKLIDGGGE